jgi:predicted esterase
VTVAAKGVWVAALLAVVGCRGRTAREDTVNEAAVSSAPLDAGGPATPPPLAGDWIEKLELENGRVAYVTPPIGSTEPRPILVAVHGAIDDAGLMCSAWRLISDVYPFVVCPAGIQVRKDTYVWPSSTEIRASIDRALAAVRAKYSDRVRSGPIVYAGFSQGANMAGPVLGHTDKAAIAFGAAVLTEGGYRAFDTPATAKAFTAQGGQRVLFTCSQVGCAGGFAGSRAMLEHAAVGAKVTYAGAFGHSIPPPVRRAIHDDLTWVVDGLEGWETYAAAPKLPTH